MKSKRCDACKLGMGLGTITWNNKHFCSRFCRDNYIAEYKPFYTKFFLMVVNTINRWRLSIAHGLKEHT